MNLPEVNSEPQRIPPVRGTRLPAPPSEASLYDAIYESRGSDVAVYLGLALPSPGPVLELGAGTGRLLIPLLSRGIDSWGLELAPGMLRAGHQRLKKVGVEGDCRRLFAGDMRCFQLNKQFSLIIVACNTVSLLLTDAELVSTFQGICKHLEPDGVLAFDVSLVEGHSWFREPYSWSGQTEAVWVEGVAATTTESGVLDPVTRLCTVRREFDLVDGRTATTEICTRQRSLKDVLTILNQAGLAPIGSPLDETGQPCGSESCVAYVRAAAC